jgi:hypothetical protein
MKFRILKYTSLDTTNNNIYIYHSDTYIIITHYNPKSAQIFCNRPRSGPTPVNDESTIWKLDENAMYGHIFYLLLRIRNIIIEYATCDQFRESMKKSTALGIFFIDSVRLI